MLFVGVSLMMFATVGTNVMRMANYYYMFVIIFIPEVFSVLKGKICINRVCINNRVDFDIF